MTRPTLTLTDLGGSPDAPLLLLGPSLGTSTIVWETAAPRLAERYRLVAWDLPGHGVAPPATAGFTVADLADRLVATLAPLSDGPVRYAGVSLGGAVGLELLLRHPDAVSRAAIVCSGAVIGEPDAWRQRAATVRARSTSALITQSAERWFAPGAVERNPSLSGRLLHALQAADDESYARCCEALADYDVRPRLAEISVPVLAVWGEHDPVTPEASARVIADGVTDGRATGIADASHLAPADNPAAVVDALLSFFER